MQEKMEDLSSTTYDNDPCLIMLVIFSGTSL